MTKKNYSKLEIPLAKEGYKALWGALRSGSGGVLEFGTAAKIQPRDGFTLIEIMVAVAILAVALTAIVGINIASARATPEIKFYVIATQLARLRIIEFEAKMREEGFSQFEESEYEGDFDEEGFPNWKWKAKVTKVELKLPTGIGGSDQQQSAISAFSGYATIISDIIKNTMREVKVTVWIEDESGYKDELTVTTHLIDNASNAMFGPPAGNQPAPRPVQAPGGARRPPSYSPQRTSPYGTSPFKGLKPFVR